MTPIGATKDKEEILQHQLDAARAELQAVRDEAERMLAGDYRDALSLVDVSVREVERQANKLLAEAEALRKIEAGKAGMEGVKLSRIAERLENRRNKILRSVQRPHLTQHRQDQARAQNRRQQDILDRKAQRYREVLRQIEAQCDDSTALGFIRHLARQVLDE